MKALPRTSPEELAELIAHQNKLWLGDASWRVVNLLSAYSDARTITMHAMVQRIGEGKQVADDGQKVRSVDIVLAVQRHFVEEILLAVKK